MQSMAQQIFKPYLMKWVDLQGGPGSCCLPARAKNPFARYSYMPSRLVLQVSSLVALFGKMLLRLILIGIRSSMGLLTGASVISRKFLSWRMQLLTHGIATAVMVQMVPSFILLMKVFVSAMTMCNSERQRDVGRHLSSKVQEKIMCYLQRTLACEHQAIVQAHFVIR